MVFDGLDAAAAGLLERRKGAEREQYVPHLARAGEEPSACRQEPAARGVSFAHQGRGRSRGQRSVAPQTKTEDKTYIRKAAYEYGWDWGPRFVTSGIWRPVRLEAWDKVRIADFAIRQRDVSKEVAHLDAEVEIEAASAGPAKVSVQYTDDGKPVIADQDGQRSCRAQRDRSARGDPSAEVLVSGGLWRAAALRIHGAVSTGGQTAEERKAKDRPAFHRASIAQLDKWGRSFELVVNGIPVFAKGADVIPFDSFPNRVTTADYRRILESARDANMNMIRHWGGGYYETEEFYSICDELGIMVWQDFMFGNDWQPGTYAFKLNIEAEAEDQVRRLRNHPSIVLWCGNNETESAFNWAPRTALPPEIRFHMWQDYLTEFSGIIPRVVARLDPETPYWPSSPSADYEAAPRPCHESGDTHDLDVWHGRVPFIDYEKHHWRFVTEYGFQSFPEMRTVESLHPARGSHRNLYAGDAGPPEEQ